MEKITIKRVQEIELISNNNNNVDNRDYGNKNSTHDSKNREERLVRPTQKDC